MNKFSLPKFGTKQVKKASAPVKKAVTQVKKAAPVARKAATTITKKVSSAVSGGTRAGGAGYRKYTGDALWLPNTTRPDWLDGSLPGDRGFDPLGLSKPVDYLQVDLDGLDQNLPRNSTGGIVGSFTPTVDQVSQDRLQPYSEVFGLNRFRECELIHGRWAMLACLGCIVAESATGVSWVEAGKVELDGAQYWNNQLPFSISQLCWIEALAVGGAEIYRNTELDPTKRCYPGGIFDPLDLGSSANAFRLKDAEIKHGRLAMISFLGFSVQALLFGEGALGSLSLFAKNLNGQ